MDVTPDEIMVFSIARQITDGEIVAQGLATPLVTAGYLLARCTHAPNLYFTSAIGQGICRRPAAFSLTRVESLWLDQSLVNVGFARAAADMLPRLRPKEFFRPAQVDPFGNFNNIAFGRSYERPRLRLPGTGGIPDVTTYISDICLYVPRHSRLTFVPQLDFVSGMGHNPERRQGLGPRCLISDLGVFDFGGGTAEQPRMRLVSLHPGVNLDHVQRHTGFPIETVSPLQETPLPGAEELRLLREEIDPMGIRRLESLSGAARRQLLHEIIIQET